MSNSVTVPLFVTLALMLPTILKADPCVELAHAKSFSFGATVRAGQVVSGQKAFSAVLHLPNPAECFKALMKRGNIEGKMYALVGLREIDPTRFQSEMKRLRTERFHVVVLATKERGVINTQSSARVLKQISDGVFKSEFEFARKRVLRLE